MARDVSDTQPVTDRGQLVEWLAAGCKPRDDYRIGTEHEKFVFYKDTHQPVPYDGVAAEGRRGIKHLLEGFQNATDWHAIKDGPHLIGLYSDAGGALSLEPGGQFELSGAPLSSLHDTARELDDHIALCHRIADPMGIGFLGLGVTPQWPLSAVPVMPKSRYQIMTAYMPKVGTRGLDMMYRTATAQVNLDFSSEADMVKKLRVALALQPLATALFANSPFIDGQPSGTLSERSNIWRDTDNQRAGMLPFVFDEGMSFERYVDYALDVPMYFIKRGDYYHNVAGASFRDLLAGKLSDKAGPSTTLSDWANHLSTIFPEVRLKRYLEMRGADVGGTAHICAVSAFFTGLLYDQNALDGAWDMVKHWSAEQRQTLRDDVPRHGLAAKIGGHELLTIGRAVLELATEGLRQRRLYDGQHRDESIYLAVLHERLTRGKTHAEDVLALYQGPWQRSLDPIYRDYAF
jgi:glutamate--cysteine ligase